MKTEKLQTKAGEMERQEVSYLRTIYLFNMTQNIEETQSLRGSREMSEHSPIPSSCFLVDIIQDQRCI